MPSEFELIARFFTCPAGHASLGVGDDAALIRPAPGMEMAISTDMLVAGRHFFPDTDPVQLGHKTLAVNLSDLAAMGAVPRWALLAMAIPEADTAWLSAFSHGFFELAERHGVSLIGGDTTRGHLNLSVTVLGEVEAGRALRRDAALPDDEIWVSGQLGGAALGLRFLLGEVNLKPEDAGPCLTRLHAPEPRISLGRALVGVANAAIDLSDGLLADLGHILDRSGLGATIDYDCLPAMPVLTHALAESLAQQCVLAGGDDNELCFTAPANTHEKVLAAGLASGTMVTCIGRMTNETGLRVLGADGMPLFITTKGYDHFAS